MASQKAWDNSLMDMTRRSFLKLAAVSGAAAALPIAFVEGAIKPEDNAARHIGSVREALFYDLKMDQMAARYDVMCLDRGKVVQYGIAFRYAADTELEEMRETAIKRLYHDMMADNIDFSTLKAPPLMPGHDRQRIV